MAQFYKLTDLSERYQLSKSSLRNYIRNGALPKPKKIGNSRRWSEEQLAEFEQSL